MKQSEMVHHCGGITCIGFNPFEPLTTDGILTDEQCWDAIEKTVERNRDKMIEHHIMEHGFKWSSAGRGYGSNLKLDVVQRIWFTKSVMSFTFRFTGSAGESSTLHLEKASHLIPITEAAMQRLPRHNH